MKKDQYTKNYWGLYEVDTQRAIEISETPDLKHVTFNGKRVFIQHVDKESNKARVYPLDDPGNEFEVQVDQLTEQN